MNSGPLLAVTQFRWTVTTYELSMSDEEHDNRIQEDRIGDEDEDRDIHKEGSKSHRTQEEEEDEPENGEDEDDEEDEEEVSGPKKKRVKVSE